MQLTEGRNKTSRSLRVDSGRLLTAIFRRNAPVSAVVLLGLSGVLLGSCSSFSGYVSDHWPTWAGGMPKDIPPRPGAPGYDEFLARQKGQNAVTSPPAEANTQPTFVVGPPSKVTGRAPPVNQPTDNSGVVQGGLY